MFFKKLLNRLVFVLQLILVVLFIVLEEVIWEGIAKPIYDYIHELHILQTIQRKLQSVNRYVILVLFLVLLFGVEGAGLVAGVLAVRGMVISAALLYGAKIPIAAFTFWLFHATEDKLLSFGWFRVAYEKIVAFFAWIKEREIYRNTVRQAREIKAWLKKNFAQFKAKYLSGDNTLSKRFGRLYRMIKRSVKRNQ
jgi:hypothetical protein